MPVGISIVPNGLSTRLNDATAGAWISAGTNSAVGWAERSLSLRFLHAPLTTSNAEHIRARYMRCTVHDAAIGCAESLACYKPLQISHQRDRDVAGLKPREW